MAYSSRGSTGFVPRVFGAAFFRRQTYRDVRNDINATGQAILVILLSSVGIATTVGVERMFQKGVSAGVLTALAVAIAYVITWIVASITVFVLGTVVFRAKATYGEVLRAFGFSDSPGILSVVGVLPFLGGLVRVVVGIWQILCGYVATRETFDLTRLQAIVTVAGGVIVSAIVQLLLESLIESTGFLG